MIREVTGYGNLCACGNQDQDAKNYVVTLDMIRISLRELGSLPHNLLGIGRTHPVAPGKAFCVIL